MLDIDNDYLEVFKREFLVQLNTVDGFDRLVCISRDNKKEEKANIIQSITPAAKEIIHNYDKSVLAKVRAYCNNNHLLAYWRWFIDFQKNYTSTNAVDQSFQMFDVVQKDGGAGFELNPVSIESFELFFYWKTTDDPPIYKSCLHNEKYKHYYQWSDCKHGMLEQISGRLRMLHRQWVAYATYVYNEFITRQKSLSSPTWDDYRVHYFLDLFLYKTSDEHKHSSSFDNIFFSCNLHELDIYIRYQMKTLKKLSLADIELFLNRQTKYYIKIAQTLNVEETAYLNGYRHLKYYDFIHEVVMMPELSNELRSSLNEKLIVKDGCVKSDGCPFAKSKGIHGNAVHEVFSSFDQMMLKVVGRWLSNQHGKTDRQ